MMFRLRPRAAGAIDPVQRGDAEFAAGQVLRREFRMENALQDTFMLKELLKKNKYLYFLLSLLVRLPGILVYPSTYKPGKNNRRKPFELQLPVTHHCNFDCVMCGMRKMADREDFTPEQLERILGDPLFQKITNAGINGGEPFLKKNLTDYIKALLKSLPRLRYIHFITNGYFTENMAAALPEIKRLCRNRGVKVTLALSVDGTGRMQDFHRGKEGAFDHIEKTCELLLSDPSKYYDAINAICTVTKHNVYNLPEVEMWSAQKGIPVSYNIATVHERIFNYEKYDDFTVFNDLLAQKMAAEFFFQKYCETKEQKYFALYYFLIYKKRLAQCSFQYNNGVTLTPDKQLAYCAVFSKSLGDASRDSAAALFYGNREYKDSICLENCNSCSHYMNTLTRRGLFIYLRDILRRRRMMY
jgi:MoaA/NifB/PqqE/SkfB family radical SAM enzyme